MLMTFLLYERVSAESLVEYTDALPVNGISMEKIFLKTAVLCPFQKKVTEAQKYPNPKNLLYSFSTFIKEK